MGVLKEGGEFSFSLGVDLMPPVDAGLLAIISSETLAVISGYGLISRFLTQSLHL